MAQYLFDFVYTFTDCMCCFPSSPLTKINGRNLKLLRLLGEGGFSYVYLVQDTASLELFALKKIRCPFGEESVSRALQEVEAYSLFAANRNIIHAIDHCVTDESRSRFRPDNDEVSSKTVYILLPYYQRGNLQDTINANLVTRSTFPEKDLMSLMLGVARALKYMHQYRVGSNTSPSVRNENSNPVNAQSSSPADRPSPSQPQEEARPLMAGEFATSQEGVPQGGYRPYAHRDIKPGNIMIDDDGVSPVLMDLGSLAQSPIAITSRSLALVVQDTAAEHSTMSYRAPELFDVKTGTIIDTKVDIWSFGCTLYACVTGKSPFEARSEETGGSLSMCILGGDWRFPDDPTNTSSGGRHAVHSAVSPISGAPAISEPVKEVIRRCLRVEPGERPDIDELIDIVQKALEQLPA